MSLARLFGGQPSQSNFHNKIKLLPDLSRIYIRSALRCGPPLPTSLTTALPRSGLRKLSPIQGRQQISRALEVSSISTFNELIEYGLQ